MDTSQYTIKLTRDWTPEELNTATPVGPITPLRSYSGNWTAVVRGSFAVHIEVFQNLGCILPEENLTDQDLEFFTNFFVQSIKDMQLPPTVANRVQFRVWVAFPTGANRSCPAGWITDSTVERNATPAGTELQGSHSFFRRDFQFENNWVLKQTVGDTSATTSSGFQFGTQQPQRFQFGAQPPSGPTTQTGFQPAPASAVGSFGNFQPRKPQQTSSVTAPSFGSFQPQTTQAAPAAAGAGAGVADGSSSFGSFQRSTSQGFGSFQPGQTTQTPQKFGAGFGARYGGTTSGFPSSFGNFGKKSGWGK